jgi:hypothetical protein
MSGQLIATITYCLSETGRSADIKAGGSGSYYQNVSGLIAPCELTLFTTSPGGMISVVFTQMEFNGPQAFGDLLAHLRERKERFSLIKTLMEAEAIAESAFGTG